MRVDIQHSQSLRPLHTIIACAWPFKTKRSTSTSKSTEDYALTEVLIFQENILSLIQEKHLSKDYDIHEVDEKRKGDKRCLMNKMNIYIYIGEGKKDGMPSS